MVAPTTVLIGVGGFRSMFGGILLSRGAKPLARQPQKVTRSPQKVGSSFRRKNIKVKLPSDADGQ